MSDVEVVGAEGTDRVLRAMERGFMDDPCYRWWFDEDNRAAGITGWNHAFLHFYGPDLVTPVSDGDTGAAMLAAVVDHDMSQDKDSMAEFVATCRLGRHDIDTMIESNQLFEDHPERDHYYMPMIAIAPSGRGRGLGRRLMAPLLERGDADGMPVYLESSNPTNLPFYRRLGFEVLRPPQRLMGFGPEVNFLMREPGGIGSPAA